MRRPVLALLSLLLLAACGVPDPAPTPNLAPTKTRAAQLARATEVAATTAAPTATATATSTATSTATASPTRTPPPPTATPTIWPTLTRPPVGGGTRQPTRAANAGGPTPTPTLPARASVAAPTPTAGPGTPRPTRPPQRPAPALPYFDTLAEPYGGWPISHAPQPVFRYTPEGFMMRLEERGIFAESVSGSLPVVADVSAEVDVTSLGEAVAGNGYGLLCRYRNSWNWYGFFVSTDGRYLITRMFEGGERTLALATAPGGPSSGPLRLRIDCVGDTLTLWVNGAVVLRASDTQLAEGRVGLYACTCGGRAATDVRFTNMIIWQPDPAKPDAPAPAPPAP